MRTMALLIVTCAMATPSLLVLAAEPVSSQYLTLEELSQCEPPLDRPDWCSWPLDVREFVPERDSCDHWRGEPLPEKAADEDSAQKQWRIDRTAEIRKAVEKDCTGTDQRLQELKTRYSRDVGIKALLDQFELDIETERPKPSR